MNTTRFYAELPVFRDFRDVTRPDSFAPLPEDWHVVMSDVRNSTIAVETGNYKNVNTLGAATITSVLNAAGSTEIPFIFEGDGSMLCVPPELLDDARAALAQTQQLASKSFGLDLRIATLPVARIREAGASILVARYQASENYIQAVFAGGGMAFADRFMKDPATAPLCAVDLASIQPRGSFEGLECRWQDIPSPHGETVSLMVKALSSNAGEAAAVFGDVIAKVREIYGTDDACNPVFPPNLAFSLNRRQLGNEVGVRAMQQGRLGKWLYLMKMRFWVLVGWFLMRFRIRTGKTDWGSYKDTLARNSDVRKFNDSFRQILSGTAAQREALAAWLEARFARRELVYGVHVTNRAHMTCLVFDYAGRHLHFIDGADGGLFLAAKALKRRVAALS
ncbi:MAG: DUF3095 domain-containing protein [Betaproteobacteria bacterium]|nr:DUF3095 domain-containing protein [Betaproteobacteria bacterium]